MTVALNILQKGQRAKDNRDTLQRDNKNIWRRVVRCVQPMGKWHVTLLPLSPLSIKSTPLGSLLHYEGAVVLLLMSCLGKSKRISLHIVLSVTHVANKTQNFNSFIHFLLSL